MREIEAFDRDIFIFDMDGTLVDSMPAWRENIRRVMVGHGATPPDDFYDPMKTMTVQEVAESIVADYGCAAVPAALVEEMNEAIRREYAETIPPKAGVYEMLEAYKAKGVKMAVFTATNRELMNALLTRLDMLKYFDCTWNCAEAGGTKEAIEPFDFIIEKMGGTRARAVVFEDGVRGLETAHNHGIFTVGVYDEVAKNEEARMRAMADRYICAWDELFCG